MAAEKKKTTVLYIDDSAVEREVVCHLLEAEGCEVVSTGDPLAGIELAGEQVPDLILLDLHMPGMDGLAVAGRLREVPALRGVPIVALSASLNEQEREEVYARFDGLLKKPIDVDALHDEIQGYISQGHEEAESGMGTAMRAGARFATPPDGGSSPTTGPGGEMLPALETLERIRSVMSHDLRTPLTVMISYASTVGREKVGDLSARQKEMLDLVVEQGFKMDELISELLSLARGTLDGYGYPPK